MTRVKILASKLAHRPTLLGLAVVAAVCLLNAAHAQDQSESRGGNLRDVCDVPPRDVSQLLDLFDPNAVITLEPLPTGTPADASTEQAIAAVVRDIAACYNANDPLRGFALLSDDWLSRSMGNREWIESLATQAPTPVPESYRLIPFEPWRVQILADGRVMAAVTFGTPVEPFPDPSRTRVLIFVLREGRWLVDEQIERVKALGCELPVNVAAVVGPPPTALLHAWPSSCGA